MYEGDSRRAREFLGAILLLESLATLGVALWLTWVTILVLPSRDPGHVALWRVVACGFFAYCGLSWSAVSMSHRIAALRWSLLVVSLAAVTLGTYGIASQTGHHFEGYIVLMGLVLAAHGATAIAFSLVVGSRSQAGHAAAR